MNRAQDHSSGIPGKEQRLHNKKLVCMTRITTVNDNPPLANSYRCISMGGQGFNSIYLWNTDHVDMQVRSAFSVFTALSMHLRTFDNSPLPSRQTSLAAILVFTAQNTEALRLTQDGVTIHITGNAHAWKDNFNSPTRVTYSSYINVNITFGSYWISTGRFRSEEGFVCGNAHVRASTYLSALNEVNNWLDVGRLQLHAGPLRGEDLETRICFK